MKRLADSELAALVQMRDEDIDTSDIPETTDWSKAVVGKFYRPIKELVSLRIDVDVLSWLRREGPGYQTRINSLLRAAMTNSSRVAGGPGVQVAPGHAREVASLGFQFSVLEKYGELEKCNRVAELIEERRSLFAPAA
jgi:uncharacterized protein (DUF4415 family)